jgi:hypothetical protein
LGWVGLSEAKPNNVPNDTFRCEPCGEWMEIQGWPPH